MNCKNCGNEIKHSSSLMLENVCSESCFWQYEDGKIVEPKDKIFEVKNSDMTLDELHFQIIKKRVEKYKQYIISRKTLNDYTPSKIFDEFLVENNLVVSRIDDSMSVIKKM